MIESIKEFINQYDYEFDLSKCNFIIQPHPILANCVGMKDGKLEHISTQEKYDYHSNIIFENIEKILKEEGDIKDKLLRIFLIHIHKPFHLPLLLSLKDELNRDDFSVLLKDIWVNTEFPNQNGKDILIDSFLYANREKLMTSKEKEELDKLSNPIKVYRGLQKDANRLGLSWTTSKEKARWFANRFENNGEILEGIIDKKDVFAYILEREEFEIILNPNKIGGIKWVGRGYEE